MLNILTLSGPKTQVSTLLFSVRGWKNLLTENMKAENVYILDKAV